MKAAALLVVVLTAGWPAERQVFEVRGQVTPPASAAISLHAVASPHTVSTLSDPGGRFRFRDVEAGAYTVAVFVPRRGETRITINVGPTVADERGRIDIRVDTGGLALSRDAAATVSSRELAVPDKARREYTEAGKKIARKDVDGAIAHLTRAVEIAPRFAAAWNHLGTIAYQTKRYQEAEDYFRKGIDADPEAYEPVVNLGGVLLNLNDADEAWRYNVEAVLRRPNDALAQSQLGMTYLALNKLDLAEKHLLEARKLDAAHFSLPQMHLAEVYLRKNDRTRAAEQLEEFLKYRPDWPDAAKMREAIAAWRSQR